MTVYNYPSVVNNKNIVTLQVSLVEQELCTLPEHMSSPPVFNGVRVARSLVLCVCFVDHMLLFVLLSFFFRPFFCLFFFELWIMLTLLESLTSSQDNYRLCKIVHTMSRQIKTVNILQENFMQYKTNLWYCGNNLKHILGRILSK